MQTFAIHSPENKNIKQVIQKYIQHENLKIEVYNFNDPFEFVAKHHELIFDMVYIHIDNQYSSFLGERMRDYNPYTSINYLTKDDDELDSRFSFYAYQYLDHHAGEESIIESFEKTLEKYVLDHKLIALQTDQGYRTIPSRDIISIHTKQNKSYITTKDEILSSKTTSTERTVRKLLKQGFIRCIQHRIINPYYMKRLVGNRAYMLNNEVYMVSDAAKKGRETIMKKEFSIGH